MNGIKRHLGLWMGSVLAATAIWACTAVRRSDGSMEIRFAPDMLVSVDGLEDALKQLTELLEDCQHGSFGRPCTPAEIAEITGAMGRVLDKKVRFSAAA